MGSLLSHLCGHHCGTVDTGRTVEARHCTHCHQEKLKVGIGSVNDHRAALGIQSHPDERAAQDAMVRPNPQEHT